MLIYSTTSCKLNVTGNGYRLMLVNPSIRAVVHTFKTVHNKVSVIVKVIVSAFLAPT